MGFSCIFANIRMKQVDHSKQAETNHNQRSVRLQKLPKHWHIVLSTGFTGLYSVLQELGFEGTLVVETIVVFRGGLRKCYLDLGAVWAAPHAPALAVAVVGGRRGRGVRRELRLLFLPLAAQQQDDHGGDEADQDYKAGNAD